MPVAVMPPPPPQPVPSWEPVETGCSPGVWAGGALLRCQGMPRALGGTETTGNGPARYPQRLPSSLPPAFSPPWLTCPFPGLLSGGPVPPGFRLLAQPPEGSGSSESVSTADTWGHSFPPPCQATVRNTHGSAPPTFPGLGISRGGDGHPESCPPSQSHYI